MPTPEERARVVVKGFKGDHYWIDTDAAIVEVAAVIQAAVKESTIDVLAALRLAHEDTCSLHCPSVRKSGDQWKHSEKCKLISAAIANAEEIEDYNPHWPFK